MASDIQQKILKYDDIFIYGCGFFGTTLYQKLIEHCCLLEGAAIRFCETHPTRTSHLGVEVLSVEAAYAKFPNALFCIGSPVHHNDMIATCVDLGIPCKNIEAENTFRFFKRSKLGTISFSLTEHCNLNCAGCVCFSCIAEKEFADLQTFKNDLDRLNQIFKGELQCLCFPGGEPLLHPEIDSFLEYARQVLPHTRLSVLTNGILLMSMPDSFWKTLKWNDINLTISKYPIKLNIEGIREKAEKYSVTLGITEYRKDKWFRVVVNPEGQLDIQDSFNHCLFANLNCMRFSKGRFYPCNTVYGARHFNRRFNQQLILTNEDSIDLYSDVTSDDIFDFLAKPIPFCRYCDTKKQQGHFEWKLSKQEISEYLT